MYLYEENVCTLLRKGKVLCFIFYLLCLSTFLHLPRMLKKRDLIQLKDEPIASALRKISNAYGIKFTYITARWREVISG